MWTGNQESTKSRHAPCFSLTRQVSMYVCFFIVVDFMVGYPSPFIKLFLHSQGPQQVMNTFFLIFQCLPCLTSVSKEDSCA